MSVLIKEAAIEKHVTDHAKRLGCLSRKMNGLGNRAWPDRMYLYNGAVMFIEFKRPGLTATPLQLHFHSMLKNMGFWVAVVDDKEFGKQVINDFVKRSA